ncbi:hypothetical protein BDR04DRAFT_1171264 [Suillus decipiens]|nr:hypothetical protein BDR04DRAFT_1171264 [Suillus decipiens]
MAHPAIWRGKQFFYPIGNTSAVCLTQDLCPSEKAEVLLLGCGDPRHIFYTVYTNSTASQKLDFTCCDLEARNAILFTLLADEGAVQKVPQIWNIFFHFYLDKASHDLLISQCRKLVELSSDLDSWNNGPYGHFLRMCTEATLAELRHLWQLYVKTTTCSSSEAKAFKSAYAADVKASKVKSDFVCTSSRAAGPLSMYALKMAGDHYNIYWETGVCSAVAKRPQEALHPNPTLAFSMVGDKFGVHYGTDPLSCFHLAEALAPAIGSVHHPEQTTLKDIFMNRSNVHEILMQTVNEDGTQNHARLAWKLLGQAEKLVIDLDHPIDIAPEQLASVLFNVYLDMFFYQNMARKMSMLKLSSSSIRISGDVHYHRRAYAEVLGVVKRRVVADWDLTMNMLHDKILGDRTLLTGMNHYQDLCCQLHLLGVFTVEWMSLQKVQEVCRLERPLVFRNWKTVPQTVCVVFVIPRARLQSFLPDLDDAGTPVLQCDVRGAITSNTFSCINTVFGTAKISGKGDGKTAAVEEDSARRYGTSPLVVWFWVPSVVFSTEDRLSVVLSVLSTPACVSLFMKMGFDLSLFRADMGDERFVHILRQRPNAVPGSAEEKNIVQVSGCPTKTPGATFVTFDKACKKPLSFTTRVDIVEPEMKASLTSGATPTVNQVSMHSIAIVLGEKSLQLPFPLPIDAKKAKLRVARKSLYIEVTLPLKLTLGDIDPDMFPVIPQGSDLALWNMHRVNLDQCVPFSITNKNALKWFNPHVSCMMSERERRIPEGLTTGSTLLDIKSTLHLIFGFASGTADVKPPLCYALQDKQKAFVMLFITDLRLDLSSHAIVADTWMMPSSPSSVKAEAFRKVSGYVMSGDNMKQLGIAAEERKAWMHLLVAATERCRTWEHKTNCEYRVQGAIPLTFEPDESPICSCGTGVGAEAFVKKYPMLRALAPHVTRAAISPLYALSYMERIGPPQDAVPTKTPAMPAPAAAVRRVCAACGKEGGAPGSLLICSRCKDVRYCSADCQRQDWKGHKKRCVPSS